MANGAASDNVRYRIGLASSSFIVATAVFFDVIGFLLMLTGIGVIATQIIGISGSILFFLWFLLLGVSFMSGKAGAKLGVMGAGTLIEAIPFINALSPTFTIATVSLIFITRKEDREKAAKEKTAREQQQRVQNKVASYQVERRQIEQQIANDNALQDAAANDNEESNEESVRRAA